MPNTIKIKNSSVAAKVPLLTDLEYGEIALNYADGKIFYKRSDNTVQNIGGSSTSAVIRSTSIASSATPTPDSSTTDQYNITALAVSATIQIPTGTPTNGQRLTIRIEDNGTARVLNWITTSGGYRVIGTTLPSTTVALKTVYIGCIYNSTDLFWDVVSVAQQA